LTASTWLEFGDALVGFCCKSVKRSSSDRQDVLAEEAECYGWINKAFDNSDAMDVYIDEILSLLVYQGSTK